MMQYAIGIDLGGTRVKGILVDATGQILEQNYQPTNDGAGEAWKAAIAGVVHVLKSKCPGALAGIGLSAPGLPDADNTCISFMPGRLFGLENFHWANFLGERVSVLNDAHAATLAEANFGAAKGLRNVVLLTLGTGVGGGIVIEGKLYQGFGQKAGSLGHGTVAADSPEGDITGMPGSIEDAIGNCSIEKRSRGRFRSTHDLVEAHLRGDHWASFVWLSSVQKLAVYIAGIINVFSPDAVILGGGIAQAGETLFAPLRGFLDVYEWRPGGHATPILPAQFGDMAGALGAASFIFKN